MYIYLDPTHMQQLERFLSDAKIGVLTLQLLCYGTLAPILVR